MIRISVLALCYNHAPFLEEALSSLAELPGDVEVLLADDASSDGSAGILRRWQVKKPDWQFIFHDVNKGNCATFNELLSGARGDWILDFATDDVLVPEQLVAWAVKASSDPDIGFCYADAFVFSGRSRPKHRFWEMYERKEFPEGRILGHIFSSGLICPPAVLFSRTALLEAGGYDESLSYEDLDCWLRLAKKYPVSHYPEAVIRYRQHPQSMSARIYQGRNRQHLQSTLTILRKVLNWPEFEAAPELLVSFIRYHLRLSFFLQLPDEAAAFYQLLDNIGHSKYTDRLMRNLAHHCPGVPDIYGIIHRARQLWRLR